MENLNKIYNACLEHVELEYIESVQGALSLMHFFHPITLKEFSKLKRARKTIEEYTGLSIDFHCNEDNFVIEEKTRNRETVRLAWFWEELKKQPKNTILLGVDNNMQPQYFSFDDFPHLLVAGQSGSGKSVFLNNLISSLLLIGDADMILIDAKQGVEFSKYGKYRTVCKNAQKSVDALKWACREMDKRYRKMRWLKLVGYQKHFQKLYVIIDELAELMMSAKKEVEPLLIRLSQLGRACGISLVVATQRPTVNVLTGLIKANIGARICFSVASNRDSINVLDNGEASRLLGKGHCLVQLPDRIGTIELQSPFISNDEVIKALK